MASAPVGNIYTAALMQHNSHPDYKYEMEGCTCSHEGINPSCGDELTLQLRIEGDVIEEASFTGSGCAVSQASADMMADLITGESVKEAKRLVGLQIYHPVPRDFCVATTSYPVQGFRG